jgi:hypothetical protein
MGALQADDGSRIFILDIDYRDTTLAFGEAKVVVIGC